MSMEQKAGHKVSNDRNHKTSKKEETIYLVRWSLKSSTIDTCEPIHHLSRQPLLKYYDKPQFSYIQDTLNTFVTPQKNGEIKRESTYKPQLIAVMMKNNAMPLEKKTNSVEYKKVQKLKSFLKTPRREGKRKRQSYG